MSDKSLGDEEVKILKYMTSCPKFLEDVLNLTVKEFHKEWINAFEERDKNTLLLAPRSHGKTTLTAGYLVWKIIQNPEIRILVVTLNQKLAENILGTVKKTFEENTELRELFGNFKGKGTWSKSSIRVRRRGKSGMAHREETLTAIGQTGSIVGSHFDIIIIDDIIDGSKCKTEKRRQDVRDWYRTSLKPMLEPHGKIIAIGTRWHANDIYSYLLKSPSFKAYKYEALIDDPREKGVEESKVLWEERWPWDDENSNNTLKNYIEENGSLAFQMQYQNRIIQTADSPIREKWIVEAQERFENLTFPDNMLKYMGVDLASESGKDYFAVSVIGIDNSNNIYVLDNLRGHYSMGKQLDIIKSMYTNWRPLKIGIESNAAQRIITDRWKNQTNLPIVQLKSSWVNDKISRAQRLAVLFETGRVLFNPNFEALRGELITFPRGEHDDCFKGDTLVKTINGYKYIRNIKVGDLVLTHKHRYKPVLKVIEKDFDGIFHKREFGGQLSLELSDDHRIYTAMHYYGNSKKPISKYRKRNFVESKKWKKTYRNVIPVDSLSENKNLVISEDRYYNKSKFDYTDKKSIVIDRDFSYVLGLFLADGCCSPGKNSSGNYNYVVDFAFNENENDLIRKVCNYFKSNGINVNIKHRKKQHCKIVEIHNKLYWHLFEECYGDDREKVLPPFYKSIGKDLKYVLRGWLDGDGWILKNREIYDEYGQSTSKKLALSMRDIALSIGWYAIIGKRKVFRYGTRCKDAYTVSIKCDRTNQCHLKSIGQDEIGSRCHKLEKYHYKGKVYDLTVKDDSSFVADGMLVHNCMDSLSFAIQASEFENKKTDWNKILDTVSSGKNKEYIQKI